MSVTQTEIGWVSAAGRALRCSAACAVMVAAALLPLKVDAASAVGLSGGAPPTMRLISEAQYLNTVRAIFGQHIDLNVRFAPVRRVNGLVTLGAAQAMVTPGAMDVFDRAAHLIAEQVVSPGYRDFVFPCRPDSASERDDACAAAFFAQAGRLLYRRQLAEGELKLLVETAGKAARTTGSFHEGIEITLVGMLLSPHFLFVQERLEADPEHPGEQRLDAYSRASRLSLLLWAAAPDDELLAAAESGALYSRAGVQQQVERMLSSPRIRDGVRAFFADFLILEDFDNLTKDQIIFPVFTAKALDDAREQQLQLVVDHLVDGQGDYRDLFTTRRTVLTTDLASVYGIPLNGGPSEWVPYDFPVGDERAGFLTQVGFLAQHAHPGRSSPTRRGMALREIMLCQHVPDPPPNVDFSLLEDPNADLRTARERLDVHNTDRTCRGCHAITDPIGLGLENFDGAGQFRRSENGVVIDPSGTLDRVDFADAVELGEAVRDNPALTACFAERVYTAGIGSPMPRDDDGTAIDQLLSELDQSGYGWQNTLRVVTLSDSFFQVPTSSESPGNSDLAYLKEE